MASHHPDRSSRAMSAVLSGAQRRVLELHRAGGSGGCVQLQCVQDFDGDVAVVQARIVTLVVDAQTPTVHRLTPAAVPAEVDRAVAAIAYDQLQRIRADYCGENGSALQVDVVLIGLSECRLLLAAPRWFADLDSLRAIARAIAGRPVPDQPAPTYADVIDLQSELLADSDAKAEHAYWRDALRNATSATVDPQAGALRESIQLPLDESASATLPSVDDAALLACWLQLLETRFGEAETVACTLTPRDVDGLADVVGPLAIVVPVTFGGGGATLARRQRDVAERLARAGELCLYFSNDVETQQDARAWRYGFASFTLAGSELALLDDGEPHALRLDVVRHATRTVLRIVFDSAQHDRAEIEWLGRQYTTLIMSAVRATDRSLGEFDLGDDLQRAFVSDAGRGPLLSIAETNFVARFASVVARTPEALALQADTLRCSYVELDRWTNRIARLLIDEGIQPGGRIGICLPRSARQVASMLGVLKAGCTCVPIDPAYPASRIARIVAQAQLSLIVTATAYRDRIGDSEEEIPLIDWERDADHIESLDADSLSIDIHPEQIAYAIFTSGSTGEPKGVQVSHRALTNYVAAIDERLQFSRIGSIAALSTVAADLGYTALFGGLGNGSCLRVLDESLSLDAAALADELAAVPVDCLKIVPSHLAALLSVDAPQRVLPRDCIVLGGEALPLDLVVRLRALSPSLRVVNHYGPTETTIGITCNAHIGPRARKFGVALGPPLANDRAYVLDARLGPCAIGVEGELCLAGDSVSTGYLGRPADTAAKFLPDPYASKPGERMYASGDRAAFDGVGALFFRGRVDHQVKLRGHRVELGEIEAAARASTHVRECAVLVSEQAGSARLIAYAVGDESSESMVRNHLAAQLPEHMQPAAWVWLERLPLTANGKLDRGALPAPGQGARVSSEASNPIEAILLQLCRELLGSTRVGVDDNFFAVGADSIIAIQLVARARQLGLFFRPKQVFEQQTIARLATVVERRTVDDTDQGLIVGDAPLTAIQARYFASVTVDRHHYNQACLYDLPPGATFEALQRAASRLLQHHDGLRTIFLRDEEGRWKQNFCAWSPALASLCCEQVTIPAGHEREDALCRVIERVQASFVLDSAPLLRLVRISDGTDAPALLLAVAHHLIVDSYSWRLIEEDLHTLLAHPDAALPLKTCPVKAWSERAQQALKSGAWQGEIEHWSDTEFAIPSLPLLPGDDLVGDAVSRRLILPDHVGAALAGGVHGAFNTNTQDFLLAALLAACAEWNGSDTLGVMLESHGRDADDVDCGRTVGWFTTMYPVLLRATRNARGDIDPVGLVTAVKEQLRAVPGQGSGYAALRYLGAQGAGGRVGEPSLCFNYLGRFGAAADTAQLHAASAMHLAQHATRSVVQPRLFAIEVLAMQHGDQLVVSIVYNPERIADASVEKICLRLQAELARLIAACSESDGGLTPSDVPDLNLQQDDLDALLAELSDVV